MNKLEQLKALLKETTQGTWNRIIPEIRRIVKIFNAWETAGYNGEEKAKSLREQLNRELRNEFMDIAQYCEMLAEAHSSLPSILEALEKAVGVLKEIQDCYEFDAGVMVRTEEAGKANQALQEINNLL